MKPSEEELILDQDIQKEMLNSAKSDLINRPGHYCINVVPLAFNDDGTVEIDCLTVVEALGFDRHHYIASAFAYVWRCLSKGSSKKETTFDLKKAVFYLNRQVGQ